MVKILGNFDTRLDEKIISSHRRLYGDDQVLYISRSGIYLFIKVILPLICRALAALALVLLVYYFLTGGNIVFIVMRFGLLALTGISFVLTAYHLLYLKLIDYYMDYAIVTPREIISIDQDGFFHRSERSLDSIKIKAISIEKQGLLSSFFDFGSLVFFSEGDADDNMGDIKLKYIYRPEKLKQRILKIIESSHYHYPSHG